MIVRTRWRMAALQLSLWIAAAGAVSYFGQQAYVGAHGLVASRTTKIEIEQLKAKLDAVKAERAGVEHRIELLGAEQLDPDLLDEEARADLGWVNPNDLVLKMR